MLVYGGLRQNGIYEGMAKSGIYRGLLESGVCFLEMFVLSSIYIMRMGRG